jgi:hypothetical protein
MRAVMKTAKRMRESDGTGGDDQAQPDARLRGLGDFGDAGGHHLIRLIDVGLDQRRDLVGGSVHLTGQRHDAGALRDQDQETALVIAQQADEERLVGSARGDSAIWARIVRAVSTTIGG